MYYAEKAADVIWKDGERIRDQLAKYSQTSPETIEVWKNFHNFGATLQISLTHTIARPGQTDGEGLKQKKEMAFMPRSIAVQFVQAGRMAGLLGWRMDMGISIAAIEWPEKFLIGALYHELYHGLKHPVDSTGFHKTGSLAHAIEEMEAHRIESLVLNAITNGLYFNRFDEIIAQTDGKPKSLVTAITIEDLQFFDQILGMEKFGLIPAQYAIGQHLNGLAAYQLEKLGRPKSEWGEFYLWLQSGGITRH